MIDIQKKEKKDKKRNYFNVVTGEYVDGEGYGIDARIFRKTDNVNLVFDSRGSYLGIQTCRGKVIDNKGKEYYTSKQGIKDFKSFIDLKMWEGIRCAQVDFIETKDGNFMQIKI
jgi:hypothetical protein